MPAKSDLIRLRHMLGAAEKALHFTRGKTRADLDKDEHLSLALVRILEIIGEAAAKVTLDCQTRNPAVPWKDIVGTRNRLIHGYEEVDLDIVWQIVSGDLPGWWMPWRRLSGVNLGEECKETYFRDVK